MRNLLVAGVAMAMLASCTSSSPTATDGEISTRSATQSSNPDGTTQAVSPSVREIGDGPLIPGTYLLGYMQPARISITVPNGWEAFANWSVLKFGNPAPVALGANLISGIYPDPCQWKDRPIEKIGGSVDDLAAAFATHADREVTAPVDVTISGYAGQMLEWRVPDDVAIATCDEREYRSYTVTDWNGANEGVRNQQAPGQVDRHYILDVDGKRLVIVTAQLADASESELSELQAIVDSIRIDVP